MKQFENRRKMHLFGYHDSFHHHDDTYTHVHQHVRIVVMGAAAVGKTSLIKQCLYHHFSDDYTRTIEDIFLYKGDKFSLEIIDTSGSHNFPEMMKIAIMAGDIFVVVFSVDDWTTFDRVAAIRKQITEMRGQDIPIIVVGNKADTQEREVPIEVADSVVCIDWGCKYHDTSANNTDQACEVFNEVLNYFPALYGEKIVHQKETVHLPTRCTKRRKSKIRSSLQSFVKLIQEKCSRESD
ncbi:GTP-binding protein Di-Ras1-like [Mercenaria mercenaria]|uniref:GTP-binding protein Di-Ras1-like n=1 Tax=Mercenaria mercenaria TaxID=6596 RepID=UPI00234F7198|nr:GTP-binding protein Di-Ras1-like [Mercenaria mercenaria]